jgi:uncharacterized metal-binding protein YceD (DUF177 family)
MKIHLKQIPVEGLHLEGDEECPISELETEEMRCTGPLHYRLDVGVSEGALWANGSLKQPVELRCVSCLQKFPFEIKVPAFTVHTELHGPEVVDLTPFMREDLLLNGPAHPHCDRDGERICKGTKTAPNRVDVEAGLKKRKHDWGELDKLKLKR